MPVIQPFPDFFTMTDSQIYNQISDVTNYLQSVYGARCFVVGGAVRDRLLGRESSDYDIECFDITKKDFEAAMIALGAQGVGKSFFVYKYGDLDIALPRRETKVGAGHKGFEVALASEEKEASQRRDFTINALMYDLQKHQIIDFWGGLEDLHHRLLRVVNVEAFVEDSLRVLRAMQFAARFGFKVEQQSVALCQQIALDDLPKARLFAEFRKMFLGEYLHFGLYYLFTLGIAEKLWGVKIERGVFIKLARILQRHQAAVQPQLREYYFLFVLKHEFGVEVIRYLQRLGAPKRYYQKLSHPVIPTVVDIPFVLRLARKEGLDTYIGNYHPEIKRIAREWDVWDSPYQSGITAEALIQEGYSGQALGEELERRIMQQIMSLKEK